MRAPSAGLKIMDRARARKHDMDLSNHAVGLLGHDAVPTIIELQNVRKLPNCGAPAWEQFINLAEAEAVEIATVILIPSEVPGAY